MARPRNEDKGSRTERIPVGVRRKKLNAPERKGFVRRVVNDDGERLRIFQDGGYSFVKKENEPAPSGDTAIGNNAGDMSGYVSFLVDRRTGLKAYLMEIPERLYKEDQEQKNESREEKFQAIRKGEGLVGQGFLPPEPGDIEF